MSIADDIRARIETLEREPDGRLKKLRLTGLRVLLHRHETRPNGETPDD